MPLRSSNLDLRWIFQQIKLNTLYNFTTQTANPRPSRVRNTCLTLNAVLSSADITGCLCTRCQRGIKLRHPYIRRYTHAGNSALAVSGWIFEHYANGCMSTKYLANVGKVILYAKCHRLEISTS